MKTLEFDTDGPEYVEFTVPLPITWGENATTIEVDWSTSDEDAGTVWIVTS